MKMLPALIALAGLAGAVASRADEVDYTRDVKPILARHCVGCHGEEKPRAGLRLDTAEHAREGGDAGPVIVPGKPDESELVLAVRGEGAGERMPLKRPPLSGGELEALRGWIAAGAEAPEGEVPSEAVHWAFVPPSRPEAPAVEGRAWVRNPIDAFILAPLEQDGIAPSPEADRATLLRRASLDVTGLLPSPAEVEAFEADDQPGAYERRVDRLLASPHYGERWGRLWLDAARYADSNGYSIDAPRSIWKYRDWVINALNADRPFDEFATDQLAGDLMPGASIDQRVATGFHRNTQINQEGGIDREQFRVEAVIDRVNTTASVFLGLTMGCCQCHDHKYDPITQEEYYRLFAFFNSVDEPDLPVATPAEVARRAEVEAEARAYLEQIQKDDPSLLERQRAWETGLTPEQRQKQSQEVREAFDTPFEARPPEKNQVVFEAFIDQDPTVLEHKTAVAAIEAKAPKPVTTMVVRERATPRETHILIGGDFTRPGDPVTPGVPAVLPSLRGESDHPTRLDLARWLFDPDHPLTARVTVNRLWQVYFGRGLVETENDFGVQGTPPSHPELLDWLAGTLVERGWSLKAIHRLILTSASYRQASLLRPDLAALDPENRRLARQSRLRLDAEVIRDAALSAGGLLVPALGGPSVFPPQPDGVMTLGQMRRGWTADTGPNRYRRGLYTFFWRATPHPLLMVFDAPDATRTCTRRVRSNTPLQALTLLNDEAFHESARSLARRVVAEGPADAQGRIAFAFRLCLARAPRPSERSRLARLLQEGPGCCPDAPDDGRGLDLGRSGDDHGEDAQVSSWITVARVLLNLDEFITRE